eukprot:scaffold7052_cov254-Pinguiococcus_pyrenoidosus.AAC.119
MWDGIASWAQKLQAGISRLHPATIELVSGGPAVEGQFQRHFAAASLAASVASRRALQRFLPLDLFHASICHGSVRFGFASVDCSYHHSLNSPMPQLNCGYPFRWERGVGRQRHNGPSGPVFAARGGHPHSGCRWRAHRVQGLHSAAAERRRPQSAAKSYLRPQ